MSKKLRRCILVILIVASSAINIIYPAETYTFHPITDAIVGGIIVSLLAYYPVLFLINLLIAIGPVISISLIILMPLMLILTNANSLATADANIIMAAVLSFAVIALIASIKTIYERKRDGLPVVNTPEEKPKDFGPVTKVMVWIAEQLDKL
jgi:hypothetical protein